MMLGKHNTQNLSFIYGNMSCVDFDLYLFFTTGRIMISGEVYGAMVRLVT